MRELGNPHEQFAVLHIAGTNGKGSVAAMAESILRHAGWRTGLFTSPHLRRIEERIRVNGREISPRAFARLDFTGSLERRGAASRTADRSPAHLLRAGDCLRVSALLRDQGADRRD